MGTINLYGGYVYIYVLFLFSLSKILSIDTQLLLQLYTLQLFYMISKFLGATYKKCIYNFCQDNWKISVNHSNYFLTNQLLI